MSEKIRKFLTGHDIDVIGFADMNLYGDELAGIDDASTRERLPYAVTFGLVLSKEILETVKGGPNHLYLHHYRQLNYRLDMVAYLLSKQIEKDGYRSLPFGASQVVDWKNQRGHISHKTVAQIAGIGWIGRNNLLVHPFYGSQVRYNTILTNAPVEPGTPLNIDCGDCFLCMKACPAGAIREQSLDFDHIRCYEMLKTFKNGKNLGHHICGICVEACRGKR